mgnify:CR=1 FL=1
MAGLLKIVSPIATEMCNRHFRDCWPARRALPARAGRTPPGSREVRSVPRATGRTPVRQQEGLAARGQQPGVRTLSRSSAFAVNPDGTPSELLLRREGGAS